MNVLNKAMLYFHPQQTKSLGEEPMRMRLRNVKGGRKWYTNFYHRGEKIEVSLEAWETETYRAQVNLGKILKELEDGTNPVAVRKLVSHLKYPRTDERGVGIMQKYILPFFGKYKIHEVDQEAVEGYIEWRWGRTPDGRLQAVRSTLKKEIRVLKQVIQTADRKWECPQVATVEAPKTKPIKHSLYPDQVVTVSKFIKVQSNKFGQKYYLAYWIAAFTGAEPSDIVGKNGLSPAMIDWRRGVILKDRGKTSETIFAPLHTGLKNIIKEMPIQFSPETPFLADLNPRNFSKAVERAFDAAGEFAEEAARKTRKPSPVDARLGNYTVKDLRRFFATVMDDQNVPESKIQMMLGHSVGSKETQKYIRKYDERVIEKSENAFATMGTLWEGASQNGTK